MRDKGYAHRQTVLVPQDRLLPEADAFKEAVHAYLYASGATERYPGIRTAVAVNAVDRSVTVTLRAPVDLPLVVPGWSEALVVAASSTAAVTVLE